MNFKTITAIIRRDVLGEVFDRLDELGITGRTLTEITGEGAYTELYGKDMASTIDHVRLEIVVHAEDADPTVQSLLNAAHTGAPGDGIVVVCPAESVYRVRSQKTMAAADLQCTC